jgi:hypothetical protein
MHIRFSKSGWRMLLWKMRCMVVDGVLDNVRAMNICERDQELVHKFEELSQLHEKNMMSGHRRQVPRWWLDKSNFDSIRYQLSLL